MTQTYRLSSNATLELFGELCADLDPGTDVAPAIPENTATGSFQTVASAAEYQAAFNHNSPHLTLVNQALHRFSILLSVLLSIIHIQFSLRADWKSVLSLTMQKYRRDSKTH